MRLGYLYTLYSLIISFNFLDGQALPSLKVINQTINFIEKKALFGPESFFQELQRIKKQTNVIAGFLVKSNTNELVYSIASATTEHNRNAIGIPLAHTNPAYTSILTNRPYVGFNCANRVTIFDKKYFARYEPFIQQFPTDPKPRLYGTAFAASICSVKQSKSIINDTIDRINQFIISFTVELYKRVISHNVVSTVFVKTGNEFLYVLNTVPSTPDTAVVGTFLDHSNPAYALALKGQTFTGQVTLFGRRYFAKYKPYTIDGRVAGISFAGVPIA